LSNDFDIKVNILNKHNNIILCSQSEKCVSRNGKQNLCILDGVENKNDKVNFSYNNISDSEDKSPRSNKKLISSDFDSIDEKKLSFDNIVKLNEFEYNNLEKISRRNSNNSYKIYNDVVIFAENNKVINMIVEKNRIIRDNKDLPPNGLKISKDTVIHNKVFLNDSKNDSNNNLEQSQNTQIANIWHKDKLKNCNNIEVKSNIHSICNKSDNQDFVRIPINNSKCKILNKRNERNFNKKISSLEIEKENIQSGNIDTEGNHNIETNTNNNINLFKKRNSIRESYNLEKQNLRRESIKELLSNRENNNGKNLQNIEINVNNNKKNKDRKRDVQIGNLLTESKTRILLTESITRKVILLILSLVIVLPILSEDVYQPDNINSYTILASYISNYKATMPEKYETIFKEFIKSEADENYPIIKITDANGIQIYRNESLFNTTFRNTEIDSSISSEGDIVILYSVLFENQIFAMLSIIKTLFVCLCLLIATIYFEKDTQKLVLDPLEIMIEIVELVSKDPIKAKDLDNFDVGAKSTYLQMQFFDEAKLKKFQKQKEKSEVKVIQSAIKKIAALLAIGLGEAGNEIIKENLSSYNDLDPMIRGRKKKAIFGFCDIRDFPVVNEVLQENTVVFLNQIADIVHSSVDLFFGATNKNIGDAFLTVWKLPSSNNNKSNLNMNLNGKKEKKDKKIIVIDKQRNSRNEDKNIQIENEIKKNEDKRQITNEENIKIIGNMIIPKHFLINLN